MGMHQYQNHLRSGLLSKEYQDGLRAARETIRHRQFKEFRVIDAVATRLS
jgi:hypothetical protein